MKIIFTLLFITITFMFFGNFLDVTKKAEKSDVVVCLGGNIDRSTIAVRLLKKHYVDKLYFVGVKSTLHYHMKKNHIDISMLEDKIIYVPKMHNTMDEILYTDKVVVKNKYKKIMIVTDPPHSRRVDFMIREFSNHLKGKYIIVSSKAKWWNKDFYFVNFKAIEFSLSELGKIVYNYLKYAIYLPFTNTL